MTIVQWLGYEDPFSRSAEEKMATLLAGRVPVRRVVRQMPFAFHPNAELLAQAVVAADVQDGFWALHDALMTHGETLDPPTLDALAETVGLDLDALHADMASDLTQAVIAEDEAVLQQLINQTLTPAFFINGRRVDGNQDLAVFELHVAQEAAATQALLDQGLSLCEAYTERLDENLE